MYYLIHYTNWEKRDKMRPFGSLLPFFATSSIIKFHSSTTVIFHLSYDINITLRLRLFISQELVDFEFGNSHLKLIIQIKRYNNPTLSQPFNTKVLFKKLD